MKYKEANIPEGLRLHVRHFSSVHSSSKWITEARLMRDGVEVAYGVSSCNPKDNPSRKIGRAIAVGRALRYYDETVNGVYRKGAKQ